MIVLGQFCSIINTAEVESSMTALYESALRNWDQFVTMGQRADRVYVAFSDGLSYVARLHAVLYELKAFLDLLARLICALSCQRSGAPTGFNRGEVDGTKVAGGKLINWIAGQGLVQVPNKDALAGAILTASVQWISAAVAVRDTLIHYRDLPGFKHARVPITGGPALIARTDILEPEMPDGTSAKDYVASLRVRLCELVSTVLPLLPQVNSGMNEPWLSASSYFNK